MATRFNANDYFEISEEQLEQDVLDSFHALKAFTERLDGHIYSEEEYQRTDNTTPYIVRCYGSLYRYAIGTEPLSNTIQRCMSMAMSFALMVGELEDGFESSMASGSGIMSAVIVQTYARYKVDRFVSGTEFSVMESISSMFGDDDLDGLSTLELAFLARIKQQSVRNKLSADDHLTLQKNANGKYVMKISDAYQWLCKQLGFTHTPTEAPVADGTISVPVSKDGSFFRKNIKGSSGYRIGKKGEEIVIANFEDALAQLKKMPTPYWRRPSATTAIPGIVTGIRWEKKSVSEVYAN